ncbi:MAG: histidine--tRNA ligase [Gammaproteobacteria bacterium]|nr:histidine--tRNA ligase [Gammaproteobacteria bacterium]
MRDLLPNEARLTRWVESRAQATLAAFGYEEIRLPVLEATELFSRGVGEATDIVEKEMYTLEDRDGGSITLRPEGTAGCVRACLEHGLIFNQPQRLWYCGPMFRHERPQKGRYRQFDQIGAEAFGIPGPDIDAELMQLGHRLFDELGVREQVTLEINTLGSAADRVRYRDALVAYLAPLRNELDEDSRRRLDRNPMRILDSKHPGTRALLEGAPAIADFIDNESRAHYEGLKSMLGALDIAFIENPRLVRGLDYYTHTVFEWVTDQLGAQGAVCSGGRYDGLIERLGGRATPGAGFGIGLDRLVLLVQSVAGTTPLPGIDGYCVVMDAQFAVAGMRLADALRAAGLTIRVHAGGGKLKSQMKRADASGARFALILGEDEIAQGRVSVKWLRQDVPQETVALDALAAYLARQSPATN